MEQRRSVCGQADLGAMSQASSGPQDEVMVEGDDGAQDVDGYIKERRGK